MLAHFEMPAFYHSVTKTSLIAFHTRLKECSLNLFSFGNEIEITNQLLYFDGSWCDLPFLVVYSTQVQTNGTK